MLVLMPKTAYLSIYPVTDKTFPMTGALQKPLAPTAPAKKVDML